MKQIAVSTPPPPPDVDLSDDDLLVIKAATVATTPQMPQASVTHSVSSAIMPHAEYVATAAPDSSNRNRLSIRFTLNLRNPVEYSLAAWLDPLRTERRFTTVIRDALRLYRDLRAGQYGVLLELFPGVYERILAENCTAASARPAPDVNLTAQLARLESLLLAGNTESASGPKPLNVAKVAGPKVDDDDEKLLTKKKAKSSGNASENFLKSAFAVAGIQ